MEGAREARPADLDRVAVLAAQVTEEQWPTRGGELLARREARPRPARDWLAEAIERPDHRVLVGTITVDGSTGEGSAEVIVGYALARLETLRDGGELAVVEEIYVEPGARGVGVGEALMDDLLAWATQRGCLGIDSIVLPGAREPKNFFERYGLVARALLVHRPLAPSVPIAPTSSSAPPGQIVDG